MRCQESVFSNWRSVPCANNATEEIDGKHLCKTHANKARRLLGVVPADAEKMYYTEGGNVLAAIWVTRGKKQFTITKKEELIGNDWSIGTRYDLDSGNIFANIKDALNKMSDTQERQLKMCLEQANNLTTAIEATNVLIEKEDAETFIKSMK